MALRHSCPYKISNLRLDLPSDPKAPIIRRTGEAEAIPWPKSTKPPTCHAPGRSQRALGAVAQKNRPSSPVSSPALLAALLAHRCDFIASAKDRWPDSETIPGVLLCRSRPTPPARTWRRRKRSVELLLEVGRAFLLLRSSPKRFCARSIAEKCHYSCCAVTTIRGELLPARALFLFGCIAEHQCCQMSGGQAPCGSLEGGR